MRIECGGNTIEVERADSIWARMRGLLGRRLLHEGRGFLIPACRSVHTMFMRFPIDVIYIDKAMMVRRVRENMKPFRLSFCAGASAVLELSSGGARRLGIESGTRISGMQREQ